MILLSFFFHIKPSPLLQSFFIRFYNFLLFFSFFSPHSQSRFFISLRVVDNFFNCQLLLFHCSTFHVFFILCHFWVFVSLSISDFCLSFHLSSSNFFFFLFHSSNECLSIHLFSFLFPSAPPFNVIYHYSSPLPIYPHPPPTKFTQSACCRVLVFLCTCAAGLQC